MSNKLLEYWAKLYNLTEAEKAIEPEIAKLGTRYRVQHPLWGLRLFPDFVLLDYKLVLEIDDSSHFTKKKQREDAERTARLQRAGWTVVRTTNEKALGDPKAALKSMLMEAKLDHLIKEN